MSKSEVLITSIDELRRHMPHIVREVNSDEKLALRAAANPVLAIRELGYHFHDELYKVLERRARFSPALCQRLDELAREVFQIAGRQFDLDSGAELAHVLFQNLGLRPTQVQAGSAQPEGPGRLEAEPLSVQVGWGTRVKDPLEKFRGQHPIMEPLLAYRELEASEPRLAPPALYNRIRSGEIRMPGTPRRPRSVPERGSRCQCERDYTVHSGRTELRDCYFGCKDTRDH